MMNSLSNESSKTFNILRIMNYVGAALIFFGIGFFVQYHWRSLNHIFLAILTSGLAIVAYLAGVWFCSKKQQDIVGNALFLLSGLLLPVGLWEIWNLFGINLDMSTTRVLLLSICFVFFGVSQLFSPRTIFILFTLLFGTGLLLELIAKAQWYFLGQYLLAHALIGVGFLYLLLGWFLSRRKESGLTGFLYCIGTLLILSMTYFLGGAFPNPMHGVLVWKIATVASIAGSFLLAVPLKSRSMLYLGSFFLVVYVVDYSMRVSQLQWSLLLIVIGIVLMLVGYIIFYVQEKIKFKRRGNEK